MVLQFIEGLEVDEVLAELTDVVVYGTYRVIQERPEGAECCLATTAWESEWCIWGDLRFRKARDHGLC